MVEVGYVLRDTFEKRYLMNDYDFTENINEAKFFKTENYRDKYIKKNALGYLDIVKVERTIKMKEV